MVGLARRNERVLVTTPAAARPIAAMAAVIGVTIIAYTPGFAAGPSFDAAVFGTLGWLARAGRLPYVDAWDHKPPVIYFLQWLWQTAVPGVDWWRLTMIASIAATAGAAGLLWLCLRRLVPTPVAFIACAGAALAMGQYSLSLGGGMTETFAVVPLVGALVLAAATRSPTWHVVAGVLVGVGIGISTLAAAGGAGILVLSLLRGRWRLGGAVAGGMVLALTAVAALLAFGGMAGAAIDANLRYVAAYSAASHVLPADLATDVLVLLPLVVPSILAVIRLRRLDADRRALAVALVVWLVAGAAGAALGHRFETHYAVLAVPPLAGLAALGAAAANRRVDRTVVALLVVPALAVAMVVAATSSARRIDQTTAENARIGLVASRVRKLTPPGSSMVVWGLEPQLHVAADRLPAGRYVYLFPLTTRGYSTAAQVEEELELWRRAAPAVIVDAGSFAPGLPGAPPLLAPRPVAFDNRDLDLLEPLRAYVRDHYRLAADVDGWLLYTRTATRVTSSCCMPSRRVVDSRSGAG